MQQPIADAGGAGTILVVDDNLINQTVIRLFLESAGYEVDVVSGGEDAITSCLRQDYDLVLMDLRMPGIDGLEATRQIRSREGSRRTPILALTACVMADDRDACEQAGMDDFIAKPINPEEVLRRVGQWLTKTREASTGTDTFDPIQTAVAG